MVLVDDDEMLVVGDWLVLEELIVGCWMVVLAERSRGQLMLRLDRR